MSINKPLLYDTGSKLSTLITDHPSLLLTLSHFGIPLGFAEKSIEAVCREHGIDPRFFLLVCSVSASEHYIPSAHELKDMEMDALIPYLKRAHQFYLKRLPHIGAHLEKLAALLPQRAATAIMRFYSAYVQEVNEHFLNEECNVYPHVEALLDSKQHTEFSTSSFLATHDNLDDKLSDLVNIIFKYLPSQANDDDDTLDMIFDILQLAQDLRKHSTVEECVLVPFVRLFEEKQ